MVERWYDELLACPACKSALLRDENTLRCASCGESFTHEGSDEHTPVQFFPSSLREHVAGESAEPSWARWREAMDGLEQWRAQRQRPLASKSDGVRHDEAHALVARANLRGTVLDVGCKDGGRKALLPEGTRYVGIDPRPIAPRETAQHSVLFAGVAEALPFRDHTMDGLLCFASFDYFVDGKKALEECARVLRPEASLALLVTVVPPELALARGAPTRRERLRGALRVASAIGVRAGLDVAREALRGAQRAHTNYYTREQLFGLLSERFVVLDVQTTERASSSILYVHARKRS